MVFSNGKCDLGWSSDTSRLRTL